MRRVMCVWCPLWPVQRLHVEQGERRSPLVLFAESRRGLHVTVCSPEAARQGIRSGMPLGEARALLPGTVTHRPRRPLFKPVFRRANPLLDRAELQRLALHCQRYSPLVGLEDVPAPESLWLDISGNEALFGGENGLIEALQADLGQQGFQARAAIADTWGTAWAVSHFGPAAVSVVPPAEQSQALASLPVGALRLADSVIDSLHSLDLSTIGRLMQLPRTALPSRFGTELLRRLDQALGTVPELLPVERSVEPLSAELLFEEPVTDRQTLEHVLGVLLSQLLGQLNDRRVSLREFQCRWLGTTTEPVSLRLLRPTTDRRHLLELLRLHCERCVFTRGVRGVRMEVVEMGLPPVRQGLLFENPADKAEQLQRALAELVDRLNSRLGCQAVLRPSLRPDPQPEFACEYVPWPGGKVFPSFETPSACRSHLRCRPLRLLRSPQPLTVAGSTKAGLPTHVNQSSIVRIVGPERIETGWWRGADARRDYYRLDLAHGAGLWAFVDRNSGDWFLHGLFV
ncbi:MAG: DNA polymerase Y family protein [Planctomycetes bacterium]|nr:DNA polymerase Y family protein [Planctomycetota bacterium]